MEEAEQPIAFTANLDADFPELIGTNKLLQVLFGHSVQFFHETENPGYFLGMLVGQAVEEFLHWARA